MTDLPDLSNHGIISVDLETKDPELKTKGSGAHRGDGFIAGVAIHTDHYCEYLPLRHEPGGNMDPNVVMPWLKYTMELPNAKCGSNLLYDMGHLKAEGIEMNGPIYDTQVAEPIIDENRFRYNLETLSQQYLGRGKFSEQLEAYLIEKFGKKNPLGNIWRAPVEIVGPYAKADASQSREVFDLQKPKLESAGLWGIFEMERKLMPLLASMKHRGVKVDVRAAEIREAELKVEQEGLIAELKRQTGREVAIWAADSIAKAFDEIGLKYPLTPKTQKPSFTKDYLDSVDHPVANMIKDARKIDKMRGTFLQGCIIDGHHNGRVHCNFNQLRSEGGGAVSGRFSSSGPNLQFIPVRDESGKKVRRMFKPDDGCIWYKFDYSQIEYVLMINDAVMFNCKGGREIADQYIADEEADFHELVAQMTGLSRTSAKTINFGLAYGEGVEKLCRSLGLSREAGEALIKQYHRDAPFMKPLIQMWQQYAASKGEIRTLLNRRRQFVFWEIYNREKKEYVVVRNRVPGARRAFTHAALNARTQGSAADVMKKAMVDIAESEICKLILPQLTVHDELDGSVPATREGYDALCEMKRLMQECVQIHVPLRTDGEIGPNWGDVFGNVKDTILAVNDQSGRGWAEFERDPNPVKLNGSKEDFDRWYAVARMSMRQLESR